MIPAMMMLFPREIKMNSPLIWVPACFTVPMNCMWVFLTHLMEDEFVYQTERLRQQSKLDEKMIRHYYLTAGYNIQLSNPAFEFLPSVFIQSDAQDNKN